MANIKTNLKQKLMNAAKDLKKRPLIIGETIVTALFIALMVNNGIQQRKQYDSDKSKDKTEVSIGEVFQNIGESISESFSLKSLLKGLGVTVLVLGGGLICVVIGAQTVYQLNENKKRKNDYLLFNLNKQDLKSGNFEVKRLSKEEYNSLKKIGTEIDGVNIYIDEQGFFSIPTGKKNYKISNLLSDKISEKLKTKTL